VLGQAVTNHTQSDLIDIPAKDDHGELTIRLALELVDMDSQPAGQIALSMRYLMAVNDGNIKLNCRCKPGLHWSDDHKGDGTMIGTVVGYRLSSGLRFGTCPSNMRKSTANVTWDAQPNKANKTERCSIGRKNDDEVAIYDLALDGNAAAAAKRKKELEKKLQARRMLEQAKKEQMLLEQHKLEMRYKQEEVTVQNRLPRPTLTASVFFSSLFQG
jgi:hypothetical protein